MRERNNKWMKSIDKYIGSPLLFLLGAIRTKQSLPELSASPCIIILKTAAIGDTIIAGSVVAELRYKFPKAVITFVCSKTNAGMAKILDGVDNVFVFEMKRPISSLRKIAKLEKQDLLIDLAPWARINGVISYVCPAKFKVGFRRKGMYRHYVYDAIVEHSDNVHEIDNYRSLLTAAGIKPMELIPDFRTNKRVRPKEERYVVFHLVPGGAMEMQRRWSNEKWIELGKRISRKYGMKILFSGSNDEHDEIAKVVDALTRQDVAAENIAGVYTLKDMASVLQYAQVVISVNTGIMHYAAAVGVPLIALHGATSELRWGPLSEKAVVVKSGEKCQPCISLGFESKCQNPKCMQNITVDMVMEAICKVISL